MTTGSMLDETVKMFKSGVQLSLERDNVKHCLSLPKALFACVAYLRAFHNPLVGCLGIFLVDTAGFLPGLLPGTDRGIPPSQAEPLLSPVSGCFLFERVQRCTAPALLYLVM
jgi:hypothetical protein